jgi:hypothetical protein
LRPQLVQLCRTWLDGYTFPQRTRAPVPRHRRLADAESGATVYSAEATADTPESSSAACRYCQIPCSAPSRRTFSGSRCASK